MIYSEKKDTLYNLTNNKISQKKKSNLKNIEKITILKKVIIKRKKCLYKLCKDIELYIYYYIVNFNNFK